MIHGRKHRVVREAKGLLVASKRKRKSVEVKSVFKCLSCKKIVGMPTPEPQGKYDVVCSHCGQVWGFSNFPDTSVYRRSQED